MLEKLGCLEAIETYWNAAAPHIQAMFCHDSLGIKVKINRVGDLKYIKKFKVSTFRWYAKNVIGDGDLLTLMSGCSGGGLSYNDPCTKFPKGPGRNMVCYQESTSYFGRVNPYFFQKSHK